MSPQLTLTHLHGPLISKAWADDTSTVFVLSGGDDFLLHVAVQDLDHLHAFLLDRLTKRREIAGFRTSVIFEQVRETAPIRLPDP